MNIETTIHPKLHHLGLTTGNIEPLVGWYRKVLGMTIVHQTDSAAGGHENTPKIKSAWVSNDEGNHRLAFMELPGLSADPDRPHHHRLQHCAFEYRNIDELLGTYARLKGLGIVPVMCSDEGAQTAFYYEDPDRNSVEIHVDNFGDCWTSGEYMRTSPEFAANPLGVFVDPEKMVAARIAGTSPWELHVRARGGEFAPARPYDLTVML
jgi:catechol 2,3-dioxygenase-like lactoylglutathione lyase family enzyme